MLSLGGSPSRGLGLSVRDPNKASPAREDGAQKVLASKTPFRTTPRPPPDWAADAPPVALLLPSGDSPAVLPPSVTAPPVVDDLRRALRRWQDFRAVRLRHVQLLAQVRRIISSPLSVRV